MLKTETYPCEAYRLDTNSLKISKVTVVSYSQTKGAGPRAKVQYTSHHNLFNTRARAVLAARSHVKLMEKHLSGFAKRVDALRAKLAALEAAK
jgi:hypothetical protein